MNKRATLLLLLAAGLSAGGPSAATVFSFSDPGELKEHFLVRKLPIVGSKPEYPEPFDWTYEWTGTTGFGGTPGAVVRDVNNGDVYSPALYYKDETFNPREGGAPLRISVCFQAEAGTKKSPSRTIVCFTDKNSQNLSSHNYPKMGARVFKNNTGEFEPGEFTLQLLATETNNVHPNNRVVSFGRFALADGHWYELTFEVSRTGAKTFSASGELRDCGLDGKARPTVVSSGSATFTNNTLGGDLTWVAGVMIQNDGGGAVALDNFSVGYAAAPESVQAKAGAASAVSE
jgi:hypothetical protein